MISYTAQKMKLSIKDFFSKCDQMRSSADLVIFTEGILNKKLHFLCSVTFTRSFPKIINVAIKILNFQLISFSNILSKLDSIFSKVRNTGTNEQNQPWWGFLQQFKSSFNTFLEDFIYVFKNFNFKIFKISTVYIYYH